VKRRRKEFLGVEFIDIDAGLQDRLRSWIDSVLERQ
jgi:hypothetical protein